MRMHGSRTLALLSVVGTLAVAPASAELVSKTYEFKENVVLELKATTSDGLRVETVRFGLPPTLDGQLYRTAGLVTADVAVANPTEHSRKVGVALALFDGQGRLLGVASGGSSVRSIRSNRIRTYRLVFDNVNAEAFRAETFQVSLETKR